MITVQKLISLILVCSIFFNQNLNSYATEATNSTALKEETQIESEVPAVISANIQMSEENKEQKDKSKALSTELVEKVVTEVEEFKQDEDQDSEEDDMPSKWEMAKNVSKYFAKKFVSDVKSYILFYPVNLVARGIANCCWFILAWLIYKKTGKDILSGLSQFMYNHENYGIIIQNIYNVLPMTIASFMYKYGYQAYTYLKMYL